MTLFKGRNNSSRQLWTEVFSKLFSEQEVRRRKAKNSVTVKAESLESRCLLTSFGQAWPVAEQSTSFAPDGTAVSGHESNLSETLGADYATEQWQTEILSAFQTWAVHTNIDLSLTSDNDEEFGAVGLTQNDPRFGDIRIGGFAQDNALASAAPFNIYNGSWSGDLFFNTNETFTIGSDRGNDLFSVALHEAGNVFGLPDSGNPDSVMFGAYLGQRDGLTDGDVDNIRRLYGSPDGDRFESGRGNDTQRKATTLSEDGTRGEISSASDADFYRTCVDTGSTINVSAAGLSLLTAEVTVFDSSGHVIGLGAATSPLDNDISVSLGDASGDVYIRVTGSDDVFGIGGYSVDVQAAGDASLAISSNVAQNESDRATRLKSVAGFPKNTRYETVGRLDGASDVDVYRFRTSRGADPTLITTIDFVVGTVELDAQLVDRSGRSVQTFT